MSRADGMCRNVTMTPSDFGGGADLLLKWVERDRSQERGTDACIGAPHSLDAIAAATARRQTLLRWPTIVFALARRLRRNKFSISRLATCTINAGAGAIATDRQRHCSTLPRTTHEVQHERWQESETKTSPCAREPKWRRLQAGGQPLSASSSVVATVHFRRAHKPRKLELDTRQSCAPTLAMRPVE